MLLKRVLFVAFLVILVALNGATIARAEAPGGYTIGVQVNPDGTWKVVEVLGLKTDLTPQNFNGLAQLLGLQVTLPSQIIPEDMIARVTQAGVAQVTLAMQGQTARVWINERLLPEVEVQPQMLGGLLGEAGGPLAGLWSFLQGTAYVRFPSEKSVQPDLTQAITSVPSVEGKIQNVVQLDGTLSHQGRWLSAGGFTRQEAIMTGLAVPQDLDPMVAAYLANYNDVAVDITPNELVLKVDDEPAVRLLWDEDSRQALFQTVEDVLGIRLDPHVFKTTEAWLEKSDVALALHLGDEPRDEAPVLNIATPINVSLADANVPTIEGIPVYGLAPRVTGAIVQTAQYAGLDQLQVCWNGGHLRWLTNSLPMPYATFGQGWLSEAIQLAGYQPLPAAARLEGVLARVALPISLSVGTGQEPTAVGCGAYEAAAATAPLAASVDASWTRRSEELALKNVNLPGIVPLDLTAKLRIPGASAFVPSGLGQVAATLGPAGLHATVDGVEYAIHWDSTLLSNLADMVDGFGYGSYVRQAAQVVGMAEVSVNIESIEGAAEVPEASSSRVPGPATESRAASGELRTVAARIPAIRPQETTEPLAQQLEGTPLVVQDQAQVALKEPLAQPGSDGAMLETTTDPTAGVCVVPEGGSLWGCWVQFGGARGTGMSWTEWSEAVMNAYSLPLNPDGAVIVQPGATIAMLLRQ